MENRIRKEDGGITFPKGFSAARTEAGIKYTGRNDMALIASDSPCTAAGVFTRNLVKAAPVVYDRREIDTAEYIQAVVVNAGIANACTGEAGMQVCRDTASAAGEVLGIPAESVLVASTGVIGMQIPTEKIISGVKAMAPHLDSTREAANYAARAIMTTDTHPKEAAVSFAIGGRTVRIGGMAKGSGMIHPNMGTMLCFIATDCAIRKDLLDAALRNAADDSFNMISVDGDTSTNDTCVVLANGEAENPEITEEDEAYQLFSEALRTVCIDIARQMAGDGEGATKLLECRVEHTGSEKDARILAKSVITSNLTKAAVFGNDANWGRILCALGYAGAAMDPEKVDLYFESDNGKIQLVHNGTALDYSEEEAARILGAPAVTAVCDMQDGEYSATAWGCDLTYDYVKINADYRS